VLFLSIYYNTNAAIIYVDSSAVGLNTGVSWTNAYTDLQLAISSSSHNDQIWIAKGTYYPSQKPTGVSSTNLKDHTFFVNKNIKLYGGFSGTETQLSQRNSINNPTILSGDLNNDDAYGFGPSLDTIITNTSDNIYHVILLLQSNTTIDGLTIKGGIPSNTSSISINGHGISRSNGGGIYIRNSISNISNCLFAANYSKNMGGAVYAEHNSTVNFQHCTFFRNIADEGGAIKNVTTLSVDSSTFQRNIADDGGAVDNYSNFTITNSLFHQNTAESGGAIFNAYSSSTITNIDNCHF